MATALSMIQRAMRLAKVIGKGEALDSDESADGLVALNSMLDSWQLERLFVYQIREESFTWAAAAASRTVGAAGNFVTDLPIQIQDCAFVQNNIDYTATLINVDQWASIPDKTTTSTLPFYIYPEYGAALVTLYAYPIPSANITFKLRSTKRLQQFAALTTTLALPPGNEEAITFSLAERFGLEFGTEIQPGVHQWAMQARRNLKRVNAPAPLMSSDAGRMNQQWSANIYSGTP